MNAQDFGDRFDTSNRVESTNIDANSPVVNSNVFADKVPVDAALIHETPMGGTVASVGPLNESVPDVIPMFETPLQEIPMGGTVAAVGPLNETVVHEAPIGEQIPFTASLGEAISAESQASKPALYEAPPVEAVPYTAPVGEAMAAEPQVSKTVPDEAPIVETITRAVPLATNAGSSAALLDHEESEHFRTRWNEIQGKFVDEPRSAVQEADALVDEVIVHITQMFAKEHSSLEGQWKQGNDVSTEDLRKALQHYRTFFNRLVV